MMKNLPKKQGLYDPAYEHDSCGIGFVANIKGERSYNIIERGLEVLERMAHRGAEVNVRITRKKPSSFDPITPSHHSTTAVEALRAGALLPRSSAFRLAANGHGPSVCGRSRPRRPMTARAWVATAGRWDRARSRRRGRRRCRSCGGPSGRGSTDDASRVRRRRRSAPDPATA